MGYGFVIDQRKCIGCHACTVACKAENEVPLGDFRTWVKYTDKGAFPAVRRHFTVLRCNHCDAAPCVEICPVNALHKRPDAIVDLDRDQCIGCRSCMQGCPYDALYLNEDSGVAEKCHYCAHRTEVGLEPACVVVCPEQAIVSGDVDDAASPIATLLREQETSQRKVEKGTKPRVWYVDALEESLVPTRAAEPPSWIWSERRLPAPEAAPGYEAPADLVTTLNAQSKPAWGWHVWLYLVTKNVAAGAMMLAPLLGVFGAEPGPWRDHAPEVVALVFLAVTGWLLVDDLGRPERFWKIFFQPNTRSWLVKGAWVINVFGALTTLALGARLLGHDAAAEILRWLNLPAAVLVSGYSAWLFEQCRGRDLWLEPDLFGNLVLRAALLGAGIGALIPHEGGNPWTWAFTILAAVCFSGIVHEKRRLAGVAWEPQARAIVTRAFRVEGALFLLAAATLLGVGAAVFGSAALAGLGLVAATAGLLSYEKAWITAGQAVPNS